MRTIWKYPLPPLPWSDHAVIEMPRGAQVRRLAMEDGSPALWAEVETQEPLERRRFVTVGTGHPWETAGAYIGAYEQGPFVWHVYEPLEIAIPENLRAMVPDFPAQNAYRLLIKEGFTLGAVPGGGWYWNAPGDEPLSAEQTLAIGELRQHGFGSVV